MMSDAQELDFQQFLDGRRPGLIDELNGARAQVQSNASSSGTLNSGGTLKLGLAAMDRTLSGYLSDTMALADRWSGPALPIDRVREMIVVHLSSVIDEFATAEAAIKVGTRPPPESAVRAMHGLALQVRKKLQIALREFELGADRDRSAPIHSVTNIVHAGHIFGGVQQAGGDAIQVNAVNLSAEAIGESLELLLSHLTEASPELLAEIEPDASTIRSQLKKEIPNGVIVQESGRTIRAVLEGAVGGALGGAMTPGLMQALTAFAATIGIG